MELILTLFLEFVIAPILWLLGLVVRFVFWMCCGAILQAVGRVGSAFKATAHFQVSRNAEEEDTK